MTITSWWLSYICEANYHPEVAGERSYLLMKSYQGQINRVSEKAYTKEVLYLKNIVVTKIMAEHASFSTPINKSIFRLKYFKNRSIKLQ